MRTKNIGYKIATSYNLIISLISIWYFGIIVLFPNEEATTGIYIVFVLITALFVLLFFSNYLLLFSNNYRLPLLKFNIWFAAVQIIHLKVLGFLFDFRSGPEFFLFIIRKTGWNFGYSSDIWNSVFTVFYGKDIEGFSFYINLIPLALMLQYCYSYKKEKKG